MAKLREKPTSIAAVQAKLGQNDTFLTPLLSHCRLPLSIRSYIINDQCLSGLHAHNCTQQMRARNPRLLSLSLIYEGIIGQHKQTTSLCDSLFVNRGRIY
jgi:hypothetical protein